MKLGPAPASPVSPGGEVAFGAYLGHAGPIDWSRAGRSAPWRAVHWKRWHYVSIAGPAFVAALAIVDIGWASSAFAYLFDRSAGRLAVDRSPLGLARLSARVADRAGEGARSTFRGPGRSFRIERPKGAPWELAVRARDLRLHAQLEETPASGTLCAIAPIEGGVANCTHKTSCLLASGTAAAGESTFEFEGYGAAIDHTSGLLARDTRWRWASAAGRGIGVNLVEGFNGPVENAVWVDGRIEPVGEAEFRFDAANPLAPWHIRTADGAVDLSFVPEGMRAENKKLLFAVSRYVQPIGTFSGTACGVQVEGLPGVTEDHHARW